MLGASARYSCFSAPVETGTPPSRQRLRCHGRAAIGPSIVFTNEIIRLGTHFFHKILEAGSNRSAAIKDISGTISIQLDHQIIRFPSQIKKGKNKNRLYPDKRHFKKYHRENIYIKEKNQSLSKTQRPSIWQHTVQAESDRVGNQRKIHPD